jgi:carbonic anhydrase
VTSPQHELFADVVGANREYASTFDAPLATGVAQRGLAVVTCIDSRIDPLGVLGMKPGDAKIVRNAGARVTDDVLRTLVLTTHLLGVSRILVMPHTDCRMAGATEEQIHEEILKRHGVDTRSLEFRTVSDQEAALRADVQRIRAYPFLNAGTVAVGGIYDVHSGELDLRV